MAGAGAGVVGEGWPTGDITGKLTRVSVEVTGYPESEISATEVRLPGANPAGTVTRFSRQKEE